MLLGRQAEGVPSHRVEHIEAPGPLVARDDVRGRVALGVADVEPRPRGVGKHVEHVELLSARVPLGAEGAVLLPVDLPPGLDGRRVVASGLARVRTWLKRRRFVVHRTGQRSSMVPGGRGRSREGRGSCGVRWSRRRPTSCWSWPRTAPSCSPTGSHRSSRTGASSAARFAGLRRRRGRPGPFRASCARSSRRAGPSSTRTRASWRTAARASTRCADPRRHRGPGRPHRLVGDRHLRAPPRRRPPRLPGPAARPD